MNIKYYKIFIKDKLVSLQMESDLISMRKEICRLKEMNVKITEREKSESSKKTGVKKEVEYIFNE